MEQTIAPLIGIAVALVIMMLRNSSGRKVRAERLWIAPAMISIVAIGLIAADPPTEPLMILAFLVVVALGAGVGWYRGKLTKLELDPATHELTSRASPAGMALILVLFAARYGLRTWLSGPDASALHLSAARLTDELLLFAVGTIVAQRVEIWLRCKKLIAEAAPPTG